MEGVICLGIRENAANLRKQGCNCAQSVLGACGSYTGLDLEMALAISAGFGGGVRSGEICGAISGAIMALGLVERDKAKVSALTARYVEQFRRQFGCVRCQELKRAGVECQELIAYCAQLTEEIIEQEKSEYGNL